ncbi:DUF456 domain-containing protein [Brevibacillus ginsengisoli]|uniref:DUF456 domain-containing protein n=1 Tax=Brevibacillus ginsengisoli TaxID=363854 RepID=UPI003CEC7939
MEILLWIMIITLFGLSLAGIFFPVLPDLILMWIGFLLYQFVLVAPGAPGLPPSFWWGMGILSALSYAADILANMYFVKRSGGSRLSSIGAIAGVILGIFVYPPLGMILLPFLFVIAIELFIQKQSIEKAIKVGFGSLFALLSSAVVKVFIQILMIIWFFIAR